MAGVAASRLVAAVSNAGALGTLGCANQPPGWIGSTAREVREKTERPFALNLLLFLADEPAIAAVLDRQGHIRVGQRDKRYLPAATAFLDLLFAYKGSVSAAAAAAGIGSAQLSKFLVDDGEVMSEANRIRTSFSLQPLRR